MKLSTVKPSIYGATATFTAERFTYYMELINESYFFLCPHYLFQEKDVHHIHLGQIGFALQSQEVVDLFLG